MTKRLLIMTVAVLFFAGLTSAATTNAQEGQAKQQTFVGVVTDTHCPLGKHMGDPAECVKKCVGMGAKYALYSGGKTYVLDPQDPDADQAQAGKRVRIKGTLDGDTIHVASITPAMPAGAAK
jgi:hypothetical protein